MSTLGQIIKKAYGGNHGTFDSPLRQIDDATSPNGVVTAPKGTHLIIDYYGNAAHNDVYFNTDGTTAWSLVHDET